MKRPDKTSCREADLCVGGPPAWTFSLRLLFLLVASVAFGLAVGRVARAGISEGILATCAVWLVVRLVGQMVGLWSVRSGTDIRDPRRNIRFGKAAGIGWRVLLCLVIIGHYAPLVGVVGGPPRIMSPLLFVRSYTVYTLIFHAALFGCLITGTVLPRAERPQRTAWRGIVASSTTLVLGLAIIAYSDMILFYLVHVSCYALEAAGPMDQYVHTRMYRGVDTNAAARNWHFFRAGCCGSVPLAVALILLPVVAGMKADRFLKTLGLLILCTVLAASHGYWLYTVGIRGVSPAFGLVLPPVSTYFRVAGIALLMAGTWAAIRLTATTVDEDMLTTRRSSVTWFRAEHPALLGLIAVAALCVLVENYVEASRSYRVPFVRYLKYALAVPENYMPAALVIVTVGRLIRRIRRRDAAAVVSLWSISPARFFAVWPVATALLALAVITAPWFVFSWCLLHPLM